MRRRLVGPLAVAAVVAWGVAAAGPARADWASTWNADISNAYPGGQFVFSNDTDTAALFTDTWSSSGSRTDAKFDATFASVTIGSSAERFGISTFGPSFSPTYGQVITVPPGAGALNSFSVYVFRISGTAPYQVTGMVVPFDLDALGPTGPPAWVGSPFDMALDESAETKVTVDTGGLALTEGDTYVLALTALDLSTSPSDSGSENLIHQSVGRTGDCDASKGYSPSWARWPHDGTGGPVCDRTLMWTDAHGWVPARFDNELNRHVPIPNAML